MKPYRITIHCSDTRNATRFPAAWIRRWHIDRNGWDDIGYHLVIQPCGEVERGRGLNVQGAHVASDNYGNVGICLIGRDRFSHNQFDALRYQLESICQTYDIERWAVYMHNQFASAQRQGKTCPNIPINEFLAWWLENDTHAIDPFIIGPEVIPNKTVI